MTEDIPISRSVGIEIMPRAAHPLDVRRAMRAQESLFRGFVRLAPFPIRMGRAKLLRARRHPSRVLGMAGKGIIRRARIVKKDHAFSVLRDRGNSPNIARSKRARAPRRERPGRSLP